MKFIYLREEGILKYFICNIPENSNEACFTFPNDIKNISSNAFQNSKVKLIALNETINTIEKSAFENCSELELVYCEDNQDNEGKQCEQNNSVNLYSIENIKLPEKNETLTIQANAFKNCEKLTTVIFPKITKKLIIEKNAFSGCESLRTIVLLADDNVEICFTENPFEDCPEYLTFICRKKSDIAKFARENEFRSIYVD